MAVEIGAVLVDIFMVIAVVVGLLAAAMLVRALLTDFRPRHDERAGRDLRVAQLRGVVPAGEPHEHPAGRAASG